MYKLKTPCSKPCCLLVDQTNLMLVAPFLLLSGALNDSDMAGEQKTREINCKTTKQQKYNAINR